MTLIINLFICGFIIFFSINRLKNDYKTFYIMFYLYYQAIITSASITYIEQGNYISEQGRYGYFVGANICFLFFFLISVYLIEYGLKILRRQTINLPKFKIGKIKLDYFLTVLVAISILFLLYINLFLSSSPLFDSSVTRFTYWENSKLNFLKSIIGNTSVFIPFIFGLIYCRKKTLGVLLLLLYILYIVLIGQKFSPLVRAIYAFFLPAVLNSNIKFNIRIFRFFKFKYAIIVLSLFGLVYIKYSHHNPFKNYGVDSPMGAIIYRVFGLQAHLFWGSVEQFVYLNKPSSWDITELYKGMHTLMRYFWYGDLEHIEGAMSRGFSFTNAYPAVLMKIFPLFFAYIFHAILIIFVYIPSAWLVERAIMCKNYFIAFISFQCFNWIGVAFIMGYFNKVIPGILILTLLIFFSFLILKIKKDVSK